MSCSGIHALDPVCHAKDIAGHLADDAFSKIAGEFGQAAASAVDWLWRQLNEATSVNLADQGIRQNMLVTGAIAGVLCVGLFLVQMMTAALRREPGALARGLKGLAVATVGSSFAIATTAVLLTVVDQLSAGVVQEATGSDLNGLGRRFGLAAGLSSVSNPAVMLIFSTVLIAAVVIVWAAMMARKLLLIVSAVMASLAFAGSAADITRAWVRRWIEVTAALIASKLILVIIFMVGLSVINGAGQQGSGVTQSGTQLIGGALILLLGGFAPLIAIKMVHFVGDSFQAVHVQSHAARAGAQTVASLPQKAARLPGAVMGRGLGAALAGKPSATSPSMPAKPATPSSSAPASQPAAGEPASRSATTTTPSRQGDQPS